MSLGEVIEYLVEKNHPLDHIYNKYTLDQLWLFYDKSVIIRRKQQYEDALVFGHCMALPLGGKEAANSFNKFLKSLLPEEFRKATYEAERREQKKKMKTSPIEAFQKLGLPIEGDKRPSVKNNITPIKKENNENGEIRSDGKPEPPSKDKRPEPPSRERRPDPPKSWKKRPKPPIAEDIE